MNKKIPKIIKEWSMAIQHRNPRQMLSFYAPESILLATYETICVGKGEIFDYFIEFLDKKNLRCEITKNLTQVSYNKDTMVASGLYTFSFTDEQGKDQEVEARYSYVISGGYIINHHSSEDPK